MRCTIEEIVIGYILLVNVYLITGGQIDMIGLLVNDLRDKRVHTMRSV